MADPAAFLSRAREVLARATPGPVRAAGGYLTTRNPEGSFSLSIYHLKELGRLETGQFQAVPFARADDAKKAALGWNSLAALCDVFEAVKDLREDYNGYEDMLENETLQKLAALDAALARLEVTE